VDLSLYLRINKARLITSKGHQANTKVDLSLYLRINKARLITSKDIKQAQKWI
jgi:hypothetical protein